MRNDQFLMRGGPSPMRNTSFLIWVCLPQMRKSRFLIDVGLPSSGKTLRSAEPGKTYRAGIGLSGAPLLANMVIRSVTSYKYGSSTLNCSALSRFYRDRRVFFPAELTAGAPPIVVPPFWFSFRRYRVAAGLTL